MNQRIILPAVVVGRLFAVALTFLRGLLPGAGAIEIFALDLIVIVALAYGSLMRAALSARRERAQCAGQTGRRREDREKRDGGRHGDRKNRDRGTPDAATPNAGTATVATSAAAAIATTTSAAATAVASAPKKSPPSRSARRHREVVQRRQGLRIHHPSGR